MKLSLLFSCLFFLLSCNSNTPSPTYEDTKQTLLEKEKSTPTIFLEVTGTYRKNLIDQLVLEGTISNNATLATYKDVVLNITYYSKTQTELGSEKKTVFDFFKPATKKDFKIKVSGYEETESVGLDIISATPTEQ